VGSSGVRGATRPPGFSGKPFVAEGTSSSRPIGRLGGHGWAGGRGARPLRGPRKRRSRPRGAPPGILWSRRRRDGLSRNPRAVCLGGSAFEAVRSRDAPAVRVGSPGPPGSEGGITESRGRRCAFEPPPLGTSTTPLESRGGRKGWGEVHLARARGAAAADLRELIIGPWNLGRDLSPGSWAALKSGKGCGSSPAGRSLPIQGPKHVVGK